MDIQIVYMHTYVRTTIPLPHYTHSLILDSSANLIGIPPVFAGKDPSRALASSSLKAEDCVPDWYDLEEEKKTVLNDWYKFFSKRYNIVGKVEGAANLDQIGRAHV